MTYDVVIRHQSHTPGDWEHAIITIIRPDPLDPNGPCADSLPDYETDVSIRLHETDTNTVALRDLCLEQGKVYKLRITFKRQRYWEPSPVSQILIDSVVLIPRIEISPFFTEPPENTRLRDFIERGCNGTIYDIHYDEYMKPDCREIINDISVQIFDGATREFI